METKGLLNPGFIKIICMVFVLFPLSGCIEEEPFRSHLRMMLNGEKVECNYYIRASDYVPPYLSPNQAITITGTWNHNKPQEGYIEFALNPYDNTAGKKSFNSFSWVRVMLTQRVGRGEYSESYIAAGNDVNLTILEVSERYIKGIFDLTPKMYDLHLSTYDSLIITSGEFHIDRKN